MAFIKFQDFNKNISSKKISPVYLFAGEEGYLIDLCVSMTEKLLEADDLNKEVFHGGESSAEDILSALQTLPFLSERRVIIVKNINKMRPDDAERIADYISNIVETSSLLLLYAGNYKKETVSKRKQLINACSASKLCVAVDCRKQYENEVREFIKNKFAKKGKTISYDTVSRIISENGTDLLNISNEIEKLDLFTGKNKKTISSEDIEQISGYTKEANIYSLAGEIEAKNMRQAVFVLEKLLEEGAEPVYILSTITSTVRRMLNAKSLLEEQNMPQSSIASSLRIHNYFAKAFFANLQKHNIDRLKEAMRIILEADISIKTGSSDSISALEKIILFVCK